MRPRNFGSRRLSGRNLRHLKSSAHSHLRTPLIQGLTLIVGDSSRNGYALFSDFLLSPI